MRTHACSLPHEGVCVLAEKGCGCVGVWVCGCVGVWVCGCKALCYTRCTTSHHITVLGPRTQPNCLHQCGMSHTSTTPASEALTCNTLACQCFCVKWMSILVDVCVCVYADAACTTTAPQTALHQHLLAYQPLIACVLYVVCAGAAYTMTAPQIALRQPAS